MRIVAVPAPVFEVGEKVLTSDGMASVYHDELAELMKEELPMEALLNRLPYQSGLIVRLLENTCSHTTTDDIHEDRYNVIQQ